MDQVQNEDMRLYPCSNCAEHYPYCFLSDHLESCLQESLQVDCRYCGESVLEKFMQNHQQNCKAYALQDTEDGVCEFCKEKIFQKFKEDHYSDCPLKQVADSYQSYKAQECPICLVEIGPADQKEFYNVAIRMAKSLECPVCRYS